MLCLLIVTSPVARIGRVSEAQNAALRGPSQRPLNFEFRAHANAVRNRVHIFPLEPQAHRPGTTNTTPHYLALHLSDEPTSHVVTSW